MVKNFLWVGLGGAIGSMLRYAVSLLVTVKEFPVATFLVNMLGSFIIGAVWAFSIKEANFNNHWRLFLATGICGGFTTFSAFSAENLAFLQTGKYGIALVYILISIIVGLGATALGFKLINHNL
jgi:fluoride exporter